MTKFRVSFKSSILLLLLHVSIMTVVYCEENQTVVSEIDSLCKTLPNYFLSNQDSGFIVAQKVLRLSELNNYEKGRIEALSGIAVFYHQSNKYDFAKEYIESALKFAEKSQDDGLIASVSFSRGFIEAENTHYDKAFEAYSRAMDLYKKMGHESSYAYVMNNMASLHYYNEEIDKAIKLFKESLILSKKHNIYHQIVLTTTNLGSMYIQQNTDSSIMYLNEALSIVQKNDLRNKTMILQGLGGAYNKMEDFSNSQKYYQEALETAIELNDQKLIGYNCTQLGDVYRGQKKYTIAIDYMIKGYEALLKQKDYFVLKETSDKLAEIYNETEDFEKALYYKSRSSTYQDSIKSKENTERLAKLRATQEYESKMLEEELKYKRRITLVIIVSGIFALIILLIIRGYIRQRRIAHKSTLTKEKLEKDLKQKDVDLLTKTMHLNEKEELMISLEEKLKQLGRDLKPSKMKGIQELITEIRISKSDNIWEEFESRFNSVNDDFLERLQKKFPDLTPKELRLCSLLRLNLSTKEISTLTHQNPLSINKARFRLRKKLDLNNTEVNLTSYLIDF